MPRAEEEGKVDGRDKWGEIKSVRRNKRINEMYANLRCI
jgi:hypothetical protein